MGGSACVRRCGWRKTVLKLGALARCMYTHTHTHIYTPTHTRAHAHPQVKLKLDMSGDSEESKLTIKLWDQDAGFITGYKDTDFLGQVTHARTHARTHGAFAASMTNYKFQVAYLIFRFHKKIKQMTCI